MVRGGFRLVERGHVDLAHLQAGKRVGLPVLFSMSVIPGRIQTRMDLVGAGIYTRDQTSIESVQRQGGLMVCRRGLFLFERADVGEARLAYFFPHALEIESSTWGERAWCAGLPDGH